MQTISINYDIKYKVDFSSNYVFLSDNSCFNIRSGRIIKQILNCRSIGYCLNGKFYSLTYLKKHLRKPVKTKCPF